MTAGNGAQSNAGKYQVDADMSRWYFRKMRVREEKKELAIFSKFDENDKSKI